MDFSSYLYIMCLIICRRLRVNVWCPLSYLHLNKGIPLGTCSLPMAMQSTMYVAKLDLILKKVQLTVFRLVIRTMTSIAWHKKPQQVNQSRHIQVNIHLHRHMEDMKLRFSCRRFEVVAKLKEGDMGVYGIAVLSFFSSGISVILILMCGITVSSCPAVCGFSSFWATVFDKRRSFTVLRYCSFGLSCLM